MPWASKQVTHMRRGAVMAIYSTISMRRMVSNMVSTHMILSTQHLDTIGAREPMLCADGNGCCRDNLQR